MLAYNKCLNPTRLMIIDRYYIQVSYYFHDVLLKQTLKQDLVEGDVVSLSRLVSNPSSSFLPSEAQKANNEAAGDCH